MKTIRAALCVAMSAALLSPTALQASVTGDTTVGAEVFSGDYDNAKFQEYRYKTDGSFGLLLKTDLELLPEDGSRFYSMGLNARTEEDVDLSMDTGSYGLYKATLGFTRMGHTFAMDAPTLYAGSGTGRLTIADEVQTALSGLTGTALVAAMNNYLDTGGRVNIGLRRDRAVLDLAWEPAERVGVSLKVDHEVRKGTRPFGAYLGNSIEILEPVDYRTTRVEEQVRYKGDSLGFGLSHSLSLLSNANTGLEFDNPFSNTYSGSTTASGGVALAPDNRASNITFDFSKKLPLRSHLVAVAGVGMLRQDDKLLPATVNPALTPGVLPRPTTEASVDTRNFKLDLKSSPTKKLRVEAGYRYDQRLNETPEFSFSGRSTNDTSISGTAVMPNYVSYIKRAAEVEAAYALGAKTEISVGVENEHVVFHHGSASLENANIYKLWFDTELSRSIGLKASLKHENKNTVYPDYTSANGEIPWIRKYYAASRDTNEATLMASYAPGGKIEAGLEIGFAVDDYPESSFGIQDSARQSLALDVNYEVTSRIMVSPSYSVEMYTVNQRDREWRSGAYPGNPYPPTNATDLENPSNWTLETKEIVHIPALNVRAILIPKKMTMDLSGSYTITDGNLAFASAVDAAAVDYNPYEPRDMSSADDSSLLALGAKMDYDVKEDFSIGLGYSFQSFKVDDDIRYDGAYPVVTDTAGAFKGNLTMDALPKNYKVSTVMVSASYRF